MILVVEREVIENVFALDIHATQTVRNDDRNFVGKGRIVGQDRRNRARVQQAVAVLMLQPFAVERGATGRGAEQEALGLNVAGEPHQIADALRAEHRVVNVERHHVHAVRRVGRAGGDEGRHRARLGDAFFENLAILRLVIVKQRCLVHRLVKLALRRVDPNLPEQRIHAEGARFVGNDRHDVFAQSFVPEQHREQAHERHRRGNFARARAFEELLEVVQFRHFQFARNHAARRNEPAHRLAPFEQIFDLGTVRRRTIERRAGDHIVADRDVEALAKFAKLLLVHLFLLVRNVAALARFTEAVALNGFGKDHRRLALVLRRRFVGGINFTRVMTAAQQFANLLIREVVHQLEQLGILAEEMFPRVAARLDDVFLVIAVHRFFHAFEEQTGLVARQQIIPVRTPDDLDDVPPRAAKQRFQLLNNLPVTAHRAVEPLEIAIDDPDQVVEVFAGCERERTERFRFIAFAVADETPDFRVLIPDEFPRPQIAIKSRLVDGHDRAEAHRDGRKLPEIRHQIRMRIGRKPAAFREFLAKILQMRLGQAAFEERAGVNSRGRVPLKIHRVAGKIFRAPAEEMVERHFVKRRRRGVSRDVPADIRG